MKKITDPLCSELTLVLPEWFSQTGLSLSFKPNDVEEAMALAVELSRANITYRTGGPFAALVVGLDRGVIISAAVNCVEAQSCSSAHAEIMALSLAQKRFGTWNLAQTPSSPLTLITSAEPCAMCLGAIPWSGVQRVVCGATKEDVEAAGFDEGARPVDWEVQLRSRGIELTTGVLREAASQVLHDYQALGGNIYNP